MSEIMGADLPQGVEPHIFKSAISSTNSCSLITVSELRIRSRNDIHGNISTHGLCGTICCCNVGAREGGTSVARMLKPVFCPQSNLRRLLIHSRAAQVAILCITIKCVSVAGLTGRSYWRWLMEAVNSRESVADGGRGDPDARSEGPSSDWGAYLVESLFSKLLSLDPGSVSMGTIACRAAYFLLFGRADFESASALRDWLYLSSHPWKISKKVSTQSPSLVQSR